MGYDAWKRNQAVKVTGGRNAFQGEMLYSGDNPAYGALDHLGITALVLLAILVLVRYGKGFVANVAVLLGVLVRGEPFTAGIAVGYKKGIAAIVDADPQASAQHWSMKAGDAGIGFDDDVLISHGPVLAPVGRENQSRGGEWEMSWTSSSNWSPRTTKNGRRSAASFQRCATARLLSAGSFATVNTSTIASG